MGKASSAFKEKSEQELKQMAADLDREIFALRNHLSLHRKLEKPHELKQKRREKARVLTFLTQKTKGAAEGHESAQ